MTHCMKRSYLGGMAIGSGSLNSIEDIHLSLPVPGSGKADLNKTVRSEGQVGIAPGIPRRSQGITTIPEYEFYESS